MSFLRSLFGRKQPVASEYTTRTLHPEMTAAQPKGPSPVQFETLRRDPVGFDAEQAEMPVADASADVEAAAGGVSDAGAEPSASATAAEDRAPVEEIEGPAVASPMAERLTPGHLAGLAPRKPFQAAAVSTRLPPISASRIGRDMPDIDEKANSRILRDVAARLKDHPRGGSSASGIWDMDSGAAARREPAARSGGRAASEEPPAPAGRKRRTKTRLLGFDTSSNEVVDLFREPTSSAPVEAPQRTRFPVGWVLVVEGPGRGECFALVTGLSQIGRGDDQAVQLDFGDAAISRTNHAAIVYDVEERSFLLGQGGKSNVVRLNGRPVISNEAMADGDLIRMGETTLRLRTFCGPDFDWSDLDETAHGEDDDDLAIA